MTLKTVSERRKHILDNIATKSIPQIAEECGASEKTIDRDIKKLKKTGEWYSWIESELLRLHKSIDVDDSTKYKEMSKLYAKGITEKHEIETRGDLVINVVFDKRMDDNGDTDQVPST